MPERKDCPPAAQMQLERLFAALADPLRRQIVQDLMDGEDGAARRCSSFPVDVCKSTMTHHFRVLREAGLISQTDYGNRCEVLLRRADLEERFPGLLALLKSDVSAPGTARAR
jgi:DNA-binding transcriptional ArsR family regulator